MRLFYILNTERERECKELRPKRTSPLSLTIYLQAIYFFVALVTQEIPQDIPTDVLVSTQLQCNRISSSIHVRKTGGTKTEEGKREREREREMKDRSKPPGVIRLTFTPRIPDENDGGPRGNSCCRVYRELSRAARVGRDCKRKR